MTDTWTSLLRRVRNPDDQLSWSEFVALYEPLLFKYVHRQGVGAEDARDVVQTIFVNLLRSLNTFDRSKGRFRTWLWQMAHYALIDLRRKKEAIRRAEQAHCQQPPQAEPDPEWKTLHHQRILEFVMEQVRKETAAKTWACFEEHVRKGRSGAEVGRELDLPANAVYVNASRILGRIRDRCLAYQEDLGDD